MMQPIPASEIVNVHPVSATRGYSSMFAHCDDTALGFVEMFDVNNFKNRSIKFHRSYWHIREMILIFVQYWRYGKILSSITEIMTGQNIRLILLLLIRIEWRLVSIWRVSHVWTHQTHGMTGYPHAHSISDTMGFIPRSIDSCISQIIREGESWCKDSPSLYKSFCRNYSLTFTIKVYHVK